MPIKQYDYIARCLVPNANPPEENPVVKEDLPPESEAQLSLEGERFKDARQNVLSNLLRHNWTHPINFGGKNTTVLDMARQVGQHTPDGNKFTEQVSGINQLD